MSAEPAWPLPPVCEELLRELGRVIALGGAWRLLRAPVASASAADYPEPWAESRDAVAAVIARTAWHAYLGGELALDDVRVPAAPKRDYLRSTQLAVVHADDARVTLELASIGNDDVAGIVAHELGRAYVAQRARGDGPFRVSARSGSAGPRSTADGRCAESIDGLPDARIGSIATVGMGLGVVALNAALHDRSAGETIGQTSHHQHQIARAGGLDWHELAFLVAVQATVRDDVLAALDTLRPSQKAAVAAWRAVLDDREDELLAMLACGDVAGETPPARADAPPAVAIHAQHAERDLERQNLGRPVFRVAERRTAVGGFTGLLAGMLGGVAMAVSIGTGTIDLVPIGLGMVAGSVRGWRTKVYRCATCGSFVTVDTTTCKGCGGTVRGEIKHRNLRLEAEEALGEAE